MKDIKTKPALQDLSQFTKFILLLMFGTAVLFAYKHFEDAYEKVDGRWVKKPDFADKVDTKTASFDECEVYYLLAVRDGLYKCYHCMNDEFYLYTNEIVKIGMTCTGRDRYRQSFYKAERVRYEVVFRGNSLECQQEEIRALGNYALLPENLARPERSSASIRERRYKLLYPPLNTNLK